VLPKAKQTVVMEEADDGCIRSAQSLNHGLVSQPVHVDEIGRQLTSLSFEVVDGTGAREAAEIVGILSPRILVQEIRAHPVSGQEVGRVPHVALTAPFAGRVLVYPKHAIG
jgi:hypothetical protein